MGRNGGPGPALAAESWLTLGEASRTLGVTPNTLRRWADAGQVPSFTTPGGHRRFPSAAIMSLVPSRRLRRPALTTMGASPDRMARAYGRARAGEPPSGDWFARLSGGERERFRHLGTELVGDLLAYLDAGPSSKGGLLATSERHAGAYGAEAAGSGASLSDTVEGFLRFRKPFVDELAVLARRRRLDTREATDLLAEAEAALDRLLVAVMLGHTTGTGDR